MKYSNLFSSLRALSIPRGTVAYLCALLMLVAGCSSSSERTSLSTFNGTLVTNATQGSSCASGAVSECGYKLGEHNGVLSCWKGVQRCVDGAWGPCLDGTISAQIAPSEAVQNKWAQSALSVVRDCVNNPCAIDCKEWEENGPNGGLTPNVTPGTDVTWVGGTFSNFPSSFLEKGLKEPCSTSADCQFDYRCKDPTSGSCSHDKCLVGAELEPSCDTCVSDICANNPSCCDNTPSNCVHDVCQTGAPLRPLCSGCAQTVCATNPECCDTAWTSACKAIAESSCGISCSCGVGETLGPDGRCYIVRPANIGNNYSNSFDEVRTACMNYRPGWDIATIPNQAVHDFIIDTLPGSGEVFIGYTKQSVGFWRWINGEPVSFTNWNQYHPQGNQECAYVKMRESNPSQRGWWSVNCGVGKSYVCQGSGSPQTPNNPSGWTEECVKEVANTCGAYCEEGGNGSGECEPWYPGDTAAHCPGVELSIGLTCSDNLPICNHGQTTAPAGVQVAVFPGSSPGFGGCSPDLTGAQMCTTTEEIPPGKCIQLSGCSGLAQGSELYVVPPAGGDCHCNNNWSIYDSSACSAATCGGETSRAAVRPVNLFLLVDKSGSMGPRWAGTTEALKSFVSDAGNAGLGVALRFFPDASGDPVTGCSNSGCNITQCAKPYVAFDRLTGDTAPTDGHESALLTAINNASPGGGTPTKVALEGALNWAKASQLANPSAINAVVLITDGVPTQCNSNITTIKSLSAAAYTDYGVRTYAIGLEGSAISFMNDLARVGGTNAANFIADAAPGVVASNLNAVLKKIAGDSVACTFTMENPGGFDASAASVTYVPGTGNVRPDYLRCRLGVGETLNGVSCYTFENSSDKSWTSAQTACEAKGAGWHLATISSDSAYSFLNSYPLLEDSWVGFTDTAVEGSAQPIDNKCGWAAKYFSGEVSSTAANCFSLRNEKDGLMSRGCYESRDYICEGAAYGQGGCGVGEIEGAGGICYSVQRTAKDWDAAKTTCEGLGAGWTLAQPKDVTATALLHDLLNCGETAWLGATDRAVSNTYRWIDNTAVPVGLFATGEPGNASGEDCLALDDTGQFVSEVCTGAHEFICAGTRTGTTRVKTVLPKVNSLASCGDGWYWEDPANPSMLSLCPATCLAVQEDLNAKLDIAMACPSSGGTATETKYTEIYEASCPSGKEPQWGFFAYDALIPGTSTVTFSGRVALQQSALVGVSWKQITVADTSTQLCAMGPPTASCPYSLFEVLGGPPSTRMPFFELEVKITPGTPAEIPTVRTWQVTYSCVSVE